MTALPSFVAQEVWRAFTPHVGFGPPRVGAEVELIPVDAATRQPVPLHGSEASILECVRSVGQRRGWHEEPRPQSGAPAFDTAEGRITFEPGGQIEFSAAPSASLTALLGSLQNCVADLRQAAEGRGIALLSVGIDPVNPIENTALQLDAYRYRAMQRHFDTIGPEGQRMMRQTASMQICLDLGVAPVARWRLLNALTPTLAAVFANSAWYEGVPSGFESYRRHVWASLDPDRTGVVCGDEESTLDDYAEFALDAPAFLIDTTGPVRPARQFVAEGAMSPGQWRAHLTTLFPEVRPRGYFEVRTVDAIPTAWFAAPLVFLCGLTLDDTNARQLGAELPAAGVDALVRAGRCGLRDPGLASLAAELAAMALDGCRRLGPDFADARVLAVAEEYFARYTFRGLSPSRDAGRIVPV